MKKALGIVLVMCFCLMGVAYATEKQDVAVEICTLRVEIQELQQAAKPKADELNKLYEARKKAPAQEKKESAAKILDLQDELQPIQEKFNVKSERLQKLEEQFKNLLHSEKKPK
jgi:Mg2+ and Co2+ transporter CorA